MIAFALLFLLQVNQTLTNPTPSDARSNQFVDPVGTSWRVFAVESHDDGPLGILEVQEIRQQNPPSSWAVLVRNRSLAPLESFRLAAAVVSGDGKVKTIQPLPQIKNLAPGSVSRQETRVQTALLMPTDRVVFFVNEVVSQTGPWKAARSDVTTLIQAAARRLPVP